MRSVAISVVVLAACALLIEASQDVVKTNNGLIQGSLLPNQRVFLGIPFAAPPVNDLRWRPPQPAAPWSGTLQTTSYSKTCSQGQSTGSGSGEDCLYLNVYAPLAPEDPNAPRFPVMLFIHGGGYVSGSASDSTYNASNILNVVQDVIVVTTNYRLGVFGFLGSNELRSRSPNNATGAYGLLDQRMAMTWVRENIGAFWGDASNVTIFGESAGSGSIANHLISPNSWGLYDRAIMQSGPIADWTAQPMVTAEYTYSLLKAQAQCDSAADPVDCLVSLSADEVLSVANAITHPETVLPLTWSPPIDGVEIPDSPQRLAAAGKINPVPVILGTNRDEGTAFVTDLPSNATEDQFVDYVTDLLGRELAPLALAQYPVSNYNGSYWNTAAQLFGDSQMTCPARRTARWINALPQAPPVYYYFFQHPLAAFGPSPLGCFHGADLYFVFHFSQILILPTELTLSQNWISYWTQFATNGNPNSAGLTKWNAFTKENDENVVLDVGQFSVESGLKQDVCDFWDEVTDFFPPTPLIPRLAARRLRKQN